MFLTPVANGKKIGVVDPGCNLPPVNDPNVIFRGLGKDDPRKTWSKKYRDTIPLRSL